MTKDLFSAQANLYSQFRPNYPEELFHLLSDLTKDHQLAWDVGTGNGQAAQALTSYYEKIHASDLSEKQLKEARSHPQIHFELGTSPKVNLSDQSVDLITVAQAFHWFQQNLFFKEVKRVAKPGAVLAIWCYEISEITPSIDSIVFDFYRNTLGPHWDPERKLVEEGYRNEVFPFLEIPMQALRLKALWSLDQFLGYLKTWSAYQKYRKANSNDPILDLEAKLKLVWNSDTQHSVEWPLSIRCFRII